MWILESSGDFLQGKRMWLKPGQRYLFGRVKKDGVRFAIDHKTVSRKHFVITVDPVKDGDVGKVHARTKITITDENSKAGTNINGRTIKASSHELLNEVTSIRPGSCPHDLVVRWQPCVLTFNLLKKEIKAGVLKTKQDRVKELDVKAIAEYVQGATTHLIVNKRNTAKGLQALIGAKPLVLESYIDALEYAAAATDLNEEENLSALEIDFDNSWPNPTDHLPPPGKEPTIRPAQSYRPDESRSKVFENFIFVFGDQSQHDNLLPPITMGEGKALMYKVKYGKTTVDEVITYMKNAAGHKHFGDAYKEADKGAVIMVRWSGPVNHEDWTQNLIHQVALKLDQRAIDQGEFLDAILANDGFLLRQAVPYGTADNRNGATQSSVIAIKPPQIQPSDSTQLRAVQAPSSAADSGQSPMRNGTRPPTASHPIESSIPDSASQPFLNGVDDSMSQPQESTNGFQRAAFEAPKKSQVMDFDDHFDPDAIAAYEDNSDVADDIPANSVPLPTRTPQTDVDRNGVKEESHPSRKRPRSISAESSYERDNDLDDLFPAAAAMKKQRLAIEAEAQMNGQSAKVTRGISTIPAPKKHQRKEVEIDVREAARAQREAGDEATLRERDRLDKMAQDFEHEPTAPANLVEVIAMKLPTRKKPIEAANGDHDDRWDPMWNGRKNFKNFRRVRDAVDGNSATSAKRNHTRLIVPLIEAKKTTHGIGDQYWDRTPEEKERNRRKKASQQQRNVLSQSQPTSSTDRRVHIIHDSDDEPENAGADAASSVNDVDSDNASNVEPSASVFRLQEEAASLLHHSVDLEAPRRTRADDSSHPSTGLSSTPGDKSVSSTRKPAATNGTKRPPTSSAGNNISKKQKTLPVTHGKSNADDSDDSDELKFRFGRGRRGANGTATKK